MKSKQTPPMQVVCLDLEGVLIPEIWINVAGKFKIKELELTTRDIPDYDELMNYRLKILKREKINLKQIQTIIGRMKPLSGATTFLNKIRKKYPIIILSDTFYEFAEAIMPKLGNPTLFCNWLKVNKSGFISGYVLRQKDGKRHAVNSFKKLGLQVLAAGDSYNDLSMLKNAHRGVFFKPPGSIVKKNPKIPVALNYQTLEKKLFKK